MSKHHSIEIPIITEDSKYLPSYSTPLASGADVKARIDHPQSLEPGDSMLIPTGLFCAIPAGYEIHIRPRSGLAYKHGVTVLNTPGTIDADYRGEIGVILINHGKEPFIIEPSMRIAQIVVTPVVQANFICTEELITTSRGEGGFGHTGVH